jgi:DNA-directed RNA polymerase subunit alpha
MMEIEMPRIHVEESEDLCYAKFVVEPLERGYGTTLGNSLRRILLSALPGAAPVGVMIEGVKHEFSTIKGVREDVVDIILNLKSLAVKTFNTDRNYKKTIRLSKFGAGTVTAKDFIVDPEVEILNPGLYICSLDSDGKLELELTIGRGRGYVSADKNKDGKAPIGFIPMDSLFTPVVKVNYNVESTRVGQNIDFDKLTIEVTTNGTISAKEVISLAAKIIEDHTKLFVNLVDNMHNIDILVSREEDKQTKILEMSIDDMELSVRSYNCLKRASINTVEDLIKKTEEDMLRVRNLGRKSLDEVINKLNALGLSLKSTDE